MKEFLLYLHQLPQNILGFALTILVRNKKVITTFSGVNVMVWFRPLFHSGVSLGNYIILDDYFMQIPNYYLTESVSHEHGHQIQSLKFGWLYLPVVGLVSMARNIWDRIAHKNWKISERRKWYYSSFPEKQADKLGGVVRAIL